MGAKETAVTDTKVWTNYRFGTTSVFPKTKERGGGEEVHIAKGSLTQRGNNRETAEKKRLMESFSSLFLINP